MTLFGIKFSQRGAAIVTWIFFLVSVIAALNNIFIEMSYWKSAFYIYNSFFFFFLARNPGILVAESWDEFDKLLENTDHKRYVMGTIPLYPAFVLMATLYIAIKQDDFMGALLSLLPI